MLKLYDSKLSPYATRVRAQLYMKGLQAEFIAVPQGGSHTPEYATQPHQQRNIVILTVSMHSASLCAVWKYQICARACIQVPFDASIGPKPVVLHLQSRLLG